MLSFTYSYKQPDGYHFSLDSIHLAEYVASQIKALPNLDSLRVLDLCAGCGVIGIELAWRINAIRQIDFMEVQDIYTDCFNHNMTQVNRPELETRWHLLNYDALHEQNWKERYDLIISNPPYFQPGHGVLSPSDFKNRCRFFIDSSFENYIRALERSLANKGKAYFLLRSLSEHGCDLFADIQKLVQGTAITAKKIAQVRGADIIFLEKQI